MKYESLLKSALELEPNKRAKLVEIIMESLSAPNPEIDQAWIAEAESRYKAYRSGAAVVKDMDDVLKKFGR